MIEQLQKISGLRRWQVFWQAFLHRGGKLAGVSQALKELGLASNTDTLQALFLGRTGDIRSDGKTIRDWSTNGDDRPVQPGRASEFDGSTQYIELPFATSLTFPFTIEGWGYTGVAGGSFFGVTDTSGDYVSIISDATTGPVIDRRRQGSSAVSTNHTENVADSSWHHLGVVVHSSTSITVYVDGVGTTYSGLTAVDIPASGGYGTGVIGAKRVSSPFGYLNGRASGVRFYNQALDSADFQKLHAKSPISKEPDSSYSLSGNHPDIAYDTIGGNHGTKNNGVIVYQGNDVPLSPENELGYGDFGNLMRASDYPTESEWGGNSNVTLTEDAVTTPNGHPATDVEPTTANGLHRIGQNNSSTLTVGDTVYVSCVAKANGYSDLRIQHATEANVSADYDLSGGTVGNPGSAVLSQSIEHLGSGWYKCKLSYQATLTAAFVQFVVLDGASSVYAGDGTSSVLTGEHHVETTDLPNYVSSDRGARITGPIPPRNSTVDAYGNPLTYKGRVPHDGLLVQSPCLTLDGVDDYVQLDTVSPIQLVGDFDFSIRAYSETGGTAARFCSDESNTHALLVTGTTMRARIASVNYDITGTSFVKDTWHHVRFVRTGSVVEGFIDGVSQGTVSASSATMNITRIGSQGTAVTDAMRLCDVDFGGTNPWYPCCENNSDKTYNVRADENHGTVNNATIPAAWANTQDDFHYYVVNGGRDDTKLAAANYVPALFGSTVKAADGGSLTHKAGDGFPDYVTKIDFSGGVPDAPWTYLKSVETAYPYKEWRDYPKYVPESYQRQFFIFDEEEVAAGPLQAPVDLTIDEIMSGYNSISLKHDFVSITNDMELYTPLNKRLHDVTYNEPDTIHYGMIWLPEYTEIELKIYDPTADVVYRVRNTGIKTKEPYSEPTTTETLYVSPTGSGTNYTLGDPGSLSGAISYVGANDNVEVILLDGEYHTDLAPGNTNNCIFRALNQHQAILSGKLDISSWTFSLVGGTSDVYQVDQAVAATIAQIHYDDGGTIKRLPGHALGQVAFTDASLDSSVAGWRYDGSNINIKVIGGGVPDVTKLKVPEVRGQLPNQFFGTTSNVLIDGLVFEYFGDDATQRIWTTRSTVSNSAVRNCIFRYNRVANIYFEGDDNLVENCEFTDDTSLMSYHQLRNSGGLTPGGPHLGITEVLALGGDRCTFRNNTHTYGMLATTCSQTSHHFEAYGNSYEKCRSINMKVDGGDVNPPTRVTFWNNTSSLAGWAFGIEDDSNSGPVYVINNSFIGCGWPGDVTSDSSTISGGFRFGGTGAGTALGHHYVYNNTVVATGEASDTDTYTGWQSWEKLFRDSRYENNVISSLLRPGETDFVHYNCCNVAAAQSVADNVTFDANQYWAIGDTGGNAEVFNRASGAAEDFAGFQADMLAFYSVTWEPNGLYSDPELVGHIVGNRQNGKTVHGVTGNTTVGTSSVIIGAHRS